MNARLKTSLETLADAHSRLDDGMQESLARIIDASIAESGVDGTLNPGELAELDRRMREDTQDAFMNKIKEIFARNGIQSRL